jgi:ribosome maturation factor RimP
LAGGMVITHLAPFETPPEGLDEARLIVENGQARRIAEIVAAPLRSVGYRLVRVRLSTAVMPVLQVMAEKPNGEMGVEDCEAASMAISPHLDLEDPIHAPYRLEMSSPGIDRPLVRESDFRRALGHEARVELAHALDGRKRFRGLIEEVEAIEGGLYIHLRPLDGPDPEIVAKLAVADMAEARLVMTEALIRDALKREKTEIRNRKSEVKKQKAESRKQKTENRKRNLKAESSP